MKILQVSAYREGDEIGSAIIAELLSFHLAKKHQVMYLCSGKKFKKKRIGKNLEVLEIPSIKIGGANAPLLTPATLINTYKMLEKFAPDIVHIHNPVLNCQLALFWANSNNTPCVITFHHIPTKGIDHIIPTLAGSKLGEIIQKTYIKTGLKGTLEKVSLVIALNKELRLSVRKVNKKVPVELINNGIDIDDYLKAKIKKPDDFYKFVFTGSYSPRKNQEFLIKAFRFLPNNFVLNLYGNKESGAGYVETLKALIDKHKIKNVSINDYVDQKKLIKVLEDVDYFVSASVREAQSLSVIEALASATPVIGLENETIDELVNNANGLVVNKNASPKKFAGMLEKFVSGKKTEYKSLARRARTSSLKFDIKKVLPKIEVVYEKVISDKLSNNKSLDQQA